MPHYIEFNGKLYLIQTKQFNEDTFITEILDNGETIASLTLEAPASDELIKITLISELRGEKVLELADD
jgi:hypothetical protein